MTVLTENEICFMSARDLADSIRHKRISAHEVMDAFLRQIERLNPRINAIVAKLDDDKCLALADDADRRLARGDEVGPLHGSPFAFKDLDPAVGFPMTRGSRIFKDFLPGEDSVLVERLKRAGVIPIGKTNVSEFGMGSHTYNDVYGVTLNPYDLTKSAGGSSGGAGAALAAGLLPLASGSDLGGSLRNPANFNNSVALRPTVGLVSSAPTALPFFGNLWTATLKTCELPGVPIWAVCHSTGVFAQCWKRSGRHLSILVASLRTLVPTSAAPRTSFSLCAHGIIGTCSARC